jgi:hypothetical protein
MHDCGSVGAGFSAQYRSCVGAAVPNLSICSSPPPSIRDSCQLDRVVLDDETSRRMPCFFGCSRRLDSLELIGPGRRRHMWAAPLQPLANRGLPGKSLQEPIDLIASPTSKIKQANLAFLFPCTCPLTLWMTIPQSLATNLAGADMSDSRERPTSCFIYSRGTVPAAELSDLALPAGVATAPELR